MNKLFNPPTEMSDDRVRLIDLDCLHRIDDITTLEFGHIREYEKSKEYVDPILLI